MSYFFSASFLPPLSLSLSLSCFEHTRTTPVCSLLDKFSRKYSLHNVVVYNQLETWLEFHTESTQYSSFKLGLIISVLTRTVQLEIWWLKLETRQPSPLYAFFKIQGVTIVVYNVTWYHRVIGVLNVQKAGIRRLSTTASCSSGAGFVPFPQQ